MRPEWMYVIKKRGEKEPIEGINGMYLMKMLKETLEIMEAGTYETEHERVSLKLSREQMEEAIVLDAAQVGEVRESYYCADVVHPDDSVYQIVNQDSFEAAGKMIQCENSESFSDNRVDETKKVRCADENGASVSEKPVLVLNFANPVNPGGGVRHGARAQEEDLCRKSTLLASLEGKKAAPYYQKHREAMSWLSSDAVILTPYVEVFRDTQGNLLEETMVVSVLTCAAPAVLRETGLSQKQLEELLYQRILGILCVAAKYGYKKLVLGAWGCGAFGNDANVVAAMFYKAFHHLREGGDNSSAGNDRSKYGKTCLFETVTFAVLDRSRDAYNYQCFLRQFEVRS